MLRLKKTPYNMGGKYYEDDQDDLIGVFASWAIQIYKLVTQEYKIPY